MLIHIYLVKSKMFLLETITYVYICIIYPYVDIICIKFETETEIIPAMPIVLMDITATLDFVTQTNQLQMTRSSFPGG